MEKMKLMIKIFTYACLAWTLYLIVGFVYGFVKAVWREVKNNGHV